MSERELGYCVTCDEYVDFDIKKELKSVSIKGSTFSVVLKRSYCKKCGQRVSVHAIEKENDIVIFDEYKKRNGLLTSKEIINLCKKRNMTQTEMARFIGIGEKDITRYVNGSIQNKCIDNLLRLVEDDESYSKMNVILHNNYESQNDLQNVLFGGYFYFQDGSNDESINEINGYNKEFCYISKLKSVPKANKKENVINGKMTYSLLNYKINDISLKLNESFNFESGKPVAINPDFTRECKRINENLIRISIFIKVEDDGSKPFSLTARIIGTFVCGEKLENEIGTKSVIDTSSSFLFPYLRQAVSEITQVSGLPPYVMPVLNMATLFEKK